VQAQATRTEIHPDAVLERQGSLLYRRQRLAAMTDWRLLLRPRKGSGVLSWRVSVCLSVCLSACMSLEPHARTSSNFLCILPVAVYRSSSGGVATCNTLCTSGFVDDIMFSYNGLHGNVTLPQQPHCNVLHGLTPCGVLGAKTRRVLHARGAGAEFAMTRCLVTSASDDYGLHRFVLLVGSRIVLEK